MSINKPVIIAALFIGGFSSFQAIYHNKPYSRILIGTYMFILVLSLLDLFGGPMATLASALAMLAALYVGITQVPWSDIFGLIGTKK